MAYKGNEVPLPLGTVGLMTDRAHSDMPPGALVKTENVVFDGTRVLKSPGSARYNSSALDGAVVGLYDWYPTPLRQRLIAVTRAGSIYRDTGNGTFTSNTAIKTGLATPSNQTVLVAGGSELSDRNRKLFIFTGSNQVQVISGDSTTVAAISDPATDWASNYPSFGIIHRNRLWAFGNENAPHRVIASNAEDHEDFTTSVLTFNIYPGRGTRLLSAIVFNEKLMFFKDSGGIFVLNDSDPDPDNWTIEELRASLGAASAHCAISVLNDVLLKNDTGSISSIAATDKAGDLESGDVLRELRNEGFMRETTSRDGNRDTHALYYPDKKQALFTYRGNGAFENNRLCIIDFAEETARVSWEGKDQITCLALRYHPTLKVHKPIYGDEDGNVFLYDTDYRSVNGSAYTGEIETPWLDFGFVDPKLVGKHKLFDGLELVFEVEGTWTVNVTVKIDGQFQQTLTYKQYLGNGLDSFVLDSSLLDNLLTDKDEPQYIPRRLLGSGRRIKINISNGGNGERFTLLRAVVRFRVADEKARRR